MLAFYLSLVDDASDREKLEQIYETYRHLMYHMALDILRNEADAEDAVHTAFLRILQNLNKIEQPKSHKTKAFVVIIVRNIAKTMLSRRRRRHEVELTEDLPSPLDVEELIEALADRTRVREAMRQLPEDSRDTLLLRYVYDFSYAQMASLLGVNESALRKRVQRGHAMLADQIRASREEETV